MVARSVAAPALALALLAAGVPVAAAGPAPVATTIDALIAGINRGDEASVERTFTADASVVDEVRPYRFPAPAAAAHWWAAFGADLQRNGATEPHLVASAPKFSSVTGARAYTVVPAVYTYKLKGKAERETGSLAFTLVQRGGAWKISSMTWAKLTDTTAP